MLFWKEEEQVEYKLLAVIVPARYLKLVAEQETPFYMYICIYLTACCQCSAKTPEPAWDAYFTMLLRIGVSHSN